MTILYVSSLTGIFVTHMKRVSTWALTTLMIYRKVMAMNPVDKLAAIWGDVSIGIYWMMERRGTKLGKKASTRAVPYKLVYKTPLCGPCGINEGFGTGTIQKVIYYVDGLCAIQILLGRVSDPPLGGVL
jgi:hypothetical protein